MRGHFLVHRRLTSCCALSWRKGWGSSLGSNPIHEGSTILTQSPPQRLCLLLSPPWGLGFWGDSNIPVHNSYHSCFWSDFLKWEGNKSNLYLPCSNAVLNIVLHVLWVFIMNIHRMNSSIILFNLCSNLMGLVLEFPLKKIAKLSLQRPSINHKEA